MSVSLNIKLNENRIANKVTNERFGKFVSASWKSQIDPFTPRKTGSLMGELGNEKLEILPFKIHYKETYAQKVYYNKAGVKFVRIGEGRNPFATDHWDIAAAQAGRLNSLYRTINNALRMGVY